MRKVFCVGRNKTGTSTMEAIFRCYKYRVAPQRTAEWLSYTAPRLLWPFVERFDAFQDAPFSHTFFIEHLYSRYPDALYILTTRDPNKWFESMINHHFSLFGLPHDAPKSDIARAMRKSSIYWISLLQFRSSPAVRHYFRQTTL